MYSQSLFASLPFQTSDDFLKRCFKTSVLKLCFLPALWQNRWFGELRILYFTGIPLYIPRTWDQINQIWPEGVGDDTVQERKVKPRLDLLVWCMRILLFVNNSWICCVMKKTLWLGGPGDTYEKSSVWICWGLFRTVTAFKRLGSLLLCTVWTH